MSSYRARVDQVVDDGGAGFAGQFAFGDHPGDRRRRDGLGSSRPPSAAVGVAVEGQPGMSGGSTDRSTRLAGSSGLASRVRERAAEFGSTADQRQAGDFRDGWARSARYAVPGVDGDPQSGRSALTSTRDRRNLAVPPARRSVAVPAGSSRQAGTPATSSSRMVASPGVLADGLAPARQSLDAVVAAAGWLAVNMAPGQSSSPDAKYNWSRKIARRCGATSRPLARTPSAVS